MKMGMKSLINSNDCLRYSLLPPVMVSMFGNIIITSLICINQINVIILTKHGKNCKTLRSYIFWYQGLMGICLSCPKQVNANMVVYNTIIRKTLKNTPEKF